MKAHNIVWLAIPLMAAACSPGDTSRSFKSDLSESRGASTLDCATNPLTDERTCTIKVSGPVTTFPTFIGQSRNIRPMLSYVFQPGRPQPRLSFHCAEQDEMKPVSGSLRVNGGQPTELRASDSFLAFLDSPPAPEDLFKPSTQVVFGLTCERTPMTYESKPEDNTPHLIALARWYLSPDRDKKPRPADAGVSSTPVQSRFQPRPAQVQPSPPPVAVAPPVAPLPPQQAQQVQQPPMPVQTVAAPVLDPRMAAMEESRCTFLRPRIWRFGESARKAYMAFVQSGGLAGGRVDQRAMQSFMDDKMREEMGGDWTALKSALFGFMPSGAPSNPTSQSFLRMASGSCAAMCQDLGPLVSGPPPRDRRMFCASVNGGASSVLIVNLMP